MIEFLVELQFIDATDYLSYAETTVDYNSIQWVNRVTEITGFGESMGLQKNYEVDRIVITIQDVDRKYRMKYNATSNQYFLNRPVIIRKIDGTLFRSVKIETWEFPEGYFQITCSRKIDMDKPIAGLITSTIWANVCDAAKNEPIPMVFNTVAKVKAWKIDNRINFGDWLLGNKEISTVTQVEIGGGIVDSSLYSLGNDGTHWWLNMGHGVLMLKGDYCLVSVTCPAKTPLQIITSVLSGIVTVGTNANFATFLAEQGYTSSNCRFHLDRQMKVAEALRIFCECFDCWYRFNASGEIIFVWINTASLTIAKNFQPTEHLALIPGTYDDEEVKTRITFHYNKNYVTGVYAGKEVYTGASSANWGILDAEYHLEMLTETVQATVTAEHIYALNKEPHATYKLEATLENWETLNNGDLIRLEDPIFERITPTLCMILRTDQDESSGKALFDVLEINDIDTQKYVINAAGYPVLREYGGYRILRT